jgi:hypothetical protein
MGIMNELWSTSAELQAHGKCEPRVDGGDALDPKVSTSPGENAAAFRAGIRADRTAPRVVTPRGRDAGEAVIELIAELVEALSDGGAMAALGHDDLAGIAEDTPSFLPAGAEGQAEDDP